MRLSDGRLIGRAGASAFCLVASDRSVPSASLTSVRVRRIQLQATEPRVKFVAQLFYLDRALVGLGQRAAPATEILAQLHRDMGDEHAMFPPEFVDLLLAGIKKVIEVVNEQDALARCIRRAAPAEQDVVGILRGGEAFPEMPL